MRAVFEAAWIERRGYVLLVSGVVIGLLSFLTGRAAFAEPQPTLPPQKAVDTTPVATTTTSTTSLNGASSKEPTPLPAGLDQVVADRSAPSAVRSLDAGCENPTVVTPPATDLPALVASSPVGACFLLEAGRHEFRDVVPKDYMSFLGTSREDVIVVGSGASENAFSGTAHSVTIGRMTFTGFQGNGGEKPQEQAPIRGTAGLWLSDRGQMATDWLVEDVVASDNLANGIFIGDHFTVRNGTFAGNGVTGIGGSEIVGGLIEGNIVHDNGDDQAVGAFQNGAGMKFTSAGVPGSPLVVRGNEVFGNNSIGIWCDIACDGFEVVDNYVHDQVSRAVMFELSRNAVIRNNLLVNSNSWTDFNRDFNAGAITIGESSDVVVEANYIDGAEAGVVVRQTRRPSLPSEAFLHDYEGVNYVAGNISVTGNTIVNTGSMGISTGATGRGIIKDPGSIRFESNTYGGADSMSFWWEGGARFSYDEWRQSGRDTANVTPIPARPAWSRATE